MHARNLAHLQNVSTVFFRPGCEVFPARAKRTPLRLRMIKMQALQNRAASCATTNKPGPPQKAAPTVAKHLSWGLTASSPFPGSGKHGGVPRLGGVVRR